MWPTSCVSSERPRGAALRLDPDGNRRAERRARRAFPGKIIAWIVDDNVEYQHAIEGTFALSESVACRGVFSSCEAALQRLRTDDERPRVVLLDILFPGMGGIEAIQLIKAESPQTFVVMLTVSNDREQLSRALTGGADGFLTKASGSEHIVRAVEEVAAGQSPIDPRMLKTLVEEFRANRVRKHSYNLTDRELEVLGLLSEKDHSSDIADSLFLSVDTIETHLKHIYTKLNCSNRTLAVAKAIREGLI